MVVKISKLVLFIFIISSLASCDSWVRPEQSATPKFLALEPTHVAGQTFKANYAGLGGIAVYLASDGYFDGTLDLKLISRDKGDEIQAESSLDLSEVPIGGFYTFEFSPLPDSNQTGYYLEIENNGKDNIALGSAGEDSYLHGALYLDSTPQDAQLAFALVYDPLQAAKGLLSEFGTWLLLLLISGLLWVLPGWILLSLFVKRWQRLHWGEKLGFAIGLSLSIYPLLILWTSIFNLQFHALYAWVPLLISLILLLWLKRKTLYPLRIPKLALREGVGWAEIVFILVVLLIFLVRFWVVRGLDNPLWGDGYQHTLITQLILENGGLFQKWLPYSDLQTFTYHFGFHANAAILSWLTGIQTNQAILWSGQVMNGLVVLALFPLAMRVRHNVWCGIITILLAGLLFSMPMFYVNWSRYTQLTGLAILAAFAGFAWIKLTTKRREITGLVISSIMLAGLALTHYRVLIFALIFLVIFIIFYSRSIGFGKLLVRIFLLGTIALALFIPWFVNIFAGKLLEILGYQMSTPSTQLVSSQESAVGIGNLFTYLPPLAWISLPILIGWALWRRNKSIALICAWWFAVFLAANPQWLGLPGVGTITSFAVLISAFFPISLILSEAFIWLIIRLKAALHASIVTRSEIKLDIRKLLTPAVSILILGIGFWGASERIGDLNPFAYTLSTRPDLYASSWIKDQLSEQSTLLVNSFFAYGGSLIAGSDGGWWLPLQANRSTTQPPLNYGAESGPFPGYASWVNALTETIEKQGIDDPEVMSMLEERGITHVYVGQRQGRVGVGDPLLDLNALNSSENYIPVYHQDRVWIFKIFFGN